MTKRIFPLLIGIITLIGFSSCQKQFKYETVPNDPMGVRIYTLDNGLKVYMSVYKDEPRIQTSVSVRVGSKHDPSETTGLAHYFEHMMFKGTSRIGSLDWEKERPLIQKVDSLFEVYRVEKDVEVRKAIYAQIDSISYEASKYAIPNEYDKLMKLIGSRGTNAATWFDYTVYIENIPSNQLENWAAIQAERFTDPVLRLFHTELETVYEEKNTTLTRDIRKVWEAMNKALFPNHPYGKQTTIGEAEHLKNPSMKNIREFFDKYYVPNNMAIILSGDFNPDEAIVVINKEFGKLKPKKLPPFTFEQEKPIQEPIVVDVFGIEAEMINIGFRFDKASSREAMIADLLTQMLFNGKAGLIDLNINLQQKALNSGAYFNRFADYSSIILYGQNKASQTLEEVREILLEQVNLLKEGDYPDWMLEATINNLKLREMKRLESNNGRVWFMSDSYINGVPWSNVVAYNDELSKITKEELTTFANEKLQNNYVVVNKLKGEPQVELVQKPPITPIHINRDVESEFLLAFRDRKVPDIEPVFVDYENDMTKIDTLGIEFIHKSNVENNTFTLYYYFPFGQDHDPMLNLASGYLEFVGTSKLTAAEVAQEFYKLACSFNVFSSRDQTYVWVSGLSENQQKAAQLLESLLTDCKPDEEALAKYIDNIIKERENAKLNQQQVFSALLDYSIFGSKSPNKNIISTRELKRLKPETLTNKIKDLSNFSHKVLYYGTLSPNELIDMVTTHKAIPNQFVEIPTPVQFVELETNTNRVVFSHYNAAQSFLQLISRGANYDINLLPTVRLYNAYFGGGMNTIVFQELREKRGLAYAARSFYSTPSNPNSPFMNSGYIATQNDKIIEAFTAFDELYNDMPVSPKSFEIAKDAIISGIRNERITKMGVIWNYITAQRMGYSQDLRKTFFETIPGMTIDDVIRFNDNYVKNKPKTYIVLGNEKVVDFKELNKKFGPIKKLTLEEIFGY